jgi:hypothetical protein
MDSVARLGTRPLVASTPIRMATLGSEASSPERAQRGRTSTHHQLFQAARRQLAMEQPARLARTPAGFDALGQRMEPEAKLETGTGLAAGT